MKKLSSPNLFILVSFLLLCFTILYYFLIPTFEYFGESYTVYKSGSSVPESITDKYPVSNRYLVLKFSRYLIPYLVTFALLYFMFSKVKRLKVPGTHIVLHLGLTTLAFILLIFLNPHIIIPQNISSDIFIEGSLQDQMLQVNEFILWYNSLQSPTSVIGIGLCLIGIVIFGVGLFRGWNAAATQSTEY